MIAKRIMIQGTGSGVGKSVICAALCRIFKQDGYSVAPFKSQNMALNSFVTKDGGEMGRAQVVQAEASCIEPTVDMNPILIKPTKDTGAQIIIKGKPLSDMSAKEYQKYKTQKELIQIVSESFLKLATEYEIVVIEGAGSPAEVNLRDKDIVNMRMAKIAQTPVVLVGDIDRGGVFAWIVGTLELLTREERNFVKGLIINKFRGDIDILKPGLDYLERKCKKEVLGVIPYFKNIKIEEEDSVSLEKRRNSSIPSKKDIIFIEVLYLPHISNFTDFDPLEKEGDVYLKYVGNGEPIGKPDLLIIPGTKNTIGDLEYLREKGYEDQVLRLVQEGKKILGICGGYQMLGEKIEDPYHTESLRERKKGLGLLSIITVLEKTKLTSQIKASLQKNNLFNTEEEIKGYEIHMGRTEFFKGIKPLFLIKERFSQSVKIEDGAIDEKRGIFGTYIHGIFENSAFRRAFLNFLRKEKGLSPLFPPRKISTQEEKDKEYNKLAELVRNNLNMKKIYKIMDLK